MEDLLDIMYTIIYFLMTSLLVIGPIQVILALNRANQMDDWDSDFGIRLNRYFKMLLQYWLAAGIFLLINFCGIDVSWAFFVFVPTLCTPLAIYYWRAVNLYNKEQG